MAGQLRVNVAQSRGGYEERRHEGTERRTLHASRRTVFRRSDASHTLLERTSNDSVLKFFASSLTLSVTPT